MGGYRRYTSFGIPVSSTAGKSLAVDTIFLRDKGGERTIGGLQVFSSPLTIIASPQEEGTDVPFNERWTIFARPDPDRTRRRLDAKFVLGAGGAFLADALIYSPPDPFPLTASRLIDLHPSIEKLKKVAHSARLGGMFAEARGARTQDLPWSGYDITSGVLMDEIQYHMLIWPPDQGTTWDYWTQAEVINYINRRVAQFVEDTGILQGKAQVAVAAGAEGVDLPSNVLKLRRVTWNGERLTPLDTWGADRLFPDWDLTPGSPQAYVEEPNVNGKIRLVPTPASSGTLGLTFIKLPVQITAASVEALPIPNLFAYGIKYGVMADMLAKQGEMNDPVRAKWCEMRYQEAIALALLLMQG